MSRNDSFAVLALFMAFVVAGLLLYLVPFVFKTLKLAPIRCWDAFLKADSSELRRLKPPRRNRSFNMKFWKKAPKASMLEMGASPQAKGPNEARSTVDGDAAGPANAYQPSSSQGLQLRSNDLISTRQGEPQKSNVSATLEASASFEDRIVDALQISDRGQEQGANAFQCLSEEFQRLQKGQNKMI